MAELFLDNIYLVLLLPFWIFLIIMIGRFFSVYVNKSIILVLTLFSSAFGFLLTTGALLKISADKILETEFVFLKINDFIINCGLHVDRTGLIFAFVLFAVSFFVQLFSASYMRGEKKAYKFYALMNLFNFAMSGLFFSPNLFQSYFFWELVGVVSYLLIGFEYNKIEKSVASAKVFIINRIGDTFLIGAIILSSYFIYSYAPNKALATLSFVDMNVISTLIYAYASSPLFEMIAAMFIIGSIVKSAQFPFYTWLQDAMEAKLPVSALLHSSTLVAAGVFLTLRLLPLYTLETSLMKIIAFIGIITAIICSISACSQINPKKALAYSTSAQFGLIYFSIGLLNLKVALALFVAHAFIKSLLFLSLPRENKKWNYFNFVLFLISALSLSGIIFSGMVVKEMLAMNLSDLGVVFVCAISFFTAFYIIRIALVAYDSNGIEKVKLSFFELFAGIGLLLLNAVFYAYLHKTAQYKLAEPFWIALIAWIFVYLLYVKNLFFKIPILYQLSYNGFYLDKLYTGFCYKLYEKLSALFKAIDDKFFSNYAMVLSFAKYGVKTFDIIENKIMNAMVNFVVNMFKKISLVDLKAQSGNIQSYNAYAFIIITMILTCLVLGYTMILIYIGG